VICELVIFLNCELANCELVIRNLLLKWHFVATTLALPFQAKISELVVSDINNPRLKPEIRFPTSESRRPKIRNPTSKIPNQ